jgi:hypothetical protein
MIGDFLLRLLVALPITLLLIVGTLFVWRRSGFGGAPAPGAGRNPLAWMAGPQDPRADRLDLVASQSLSPGVRIAVLRYGGHDYLVGAGPQGVSLLATRDALLPLAAPSPDAPHGEPSQ